MRKLGILGQRRNGARDLVAFFPFSEFQIVILLQVQPHLCRRAEEAAQPDRRIGGNCPPPGEDLRDTGLLYPQLLGQPILRESGALHTALY